MHRTVVLLLLLCSTGVASATTVTERRFDQLAKQLQQQLSSPRAFYLLAQISTLANHWQSEQADALHQSVSRLRSIFETQPLIPALKDIVAHFSNDPGWRPVRPPLTSLSPDQAASLRETLQGIDFQFPFTAHG